MPDYVTKDGRRVPVGGPVEDAFDVPTAAPKRTDGERAAAYRSALQAIVATQGSYAACIAASALQED